MSDSIRQGAIRPRIARMEVQPEKFQFLWLWYVSGVNTAKHCQATFRGAKSAFVKPSVTMYRDLPLDERDAQVFYLCGVARKRHTATQKNGNNFHLAFRRRPGKTIVCHELGVDLEIADAERLRIEPVGPPDDCRHPDFTTCRNWQFAMAYERAEGKADTLKAF